jgi:hypothetical protein
MVVPFAFPRHSADLSAGFNQALKDDLSHFRRICDHRPKVAAVERSARFYNRKPRPEGTKGGAQWGGSPRGFSKRAVQHF